MSIFTVKVVMFLMMIISSEVLIYFTSVESLKVSVNRATQLISIFQFYESVYLINR